MRGALRPGIAGRRVTLERPGRQVLARAKTGRQRALRAVVPDARRRHDAAAPALPRRPRERGPPGAAPAWSTPTSESYASWYEDGGATACGFHAHYGVAHRTLPLRHEGGDPLRRPQRRGHGRRPRTRSSAVATGTSTAPWPARWGSAAPAPSGSAADHLRHPSSARGSRSGAPRASGAGRTLRRPCARSPTWTSTRSTSAWSCGAGRSCGDCPSSWPAAGRAPS